MGMIYLVLERDEDIGKVFLGAFSTKELAKEFINVFKYPDAFCIEDFSIDTVSADTFSFPKKNEKEYEVYMTTDGKVLEVRDTVYSIYFGVRITNFSPEYCGVLFNHCYAKNEEDAIYKTNEERIRGAYGT